MGTWGTSAFCLLTLLLTAASQPAFGGQITFDNVANNTVIDNAYPGVTFGCVACGSGHAYARDMSAWGSTTAASEANVITLIGPPGSGDPNASTLTSFNGTYGAVTVVFATPQRTVTVLARPQLPLEFLGSGLNKPFLEAYSSVTQNGSTFLGRVLYPLNYGSGGYCDTGASACGGPWQALTFTSGSDNIVSLRLSSQISQGGPNVYADFDNLSFETTPAIVVSVPETNVCVNFNSGVPAGMTVFGSATVNGGFLKLTDSSGGLGVSYLNDFNGGAKVTAFQATFKAALFGSTCCGNGAFPADGFSFNLVSAAATPATPDLTQAVEEGIGQGLTVSFDTWDNGNFEAPAIDVKWQGQTVASVPFQASQSPIGAPDAASASRNVIINLEDDGTIDVSYGGVVVINNVQTPYNPATIGAPKWIFGARTGLATDNHWIDDLCITTRSGSKLCTDFTSAPPGTSLFGDANISAGRLKLLPLPATAGYGIAYFNDFSAGNFVQGFKATFKAALFGSTCCGNGAFPADGFSFNLVPASSALSNPGYNQPAEEGLDEGLSITFDTWDNTGGGEAPAVDVKWKGNFIASVPFMASQSPGGAVDFNSAARDVVIELKADGRLDVSYGGIVLFNNLAVPYNPAAIGVPQWVMGARIGGANDNYEFDDLCIATVSAPGRQIARLYNTGVNGAGQALADNAIDSHYRLLMPSTPDAFVATSAGGFPIPPWLGDTTVSAWISPSTDTVVPSGGTPVTSYRYETTFDLTGFNPATARLGGRWATDNNGLDILINGISTGNLNNSQFGVWTPFAITSGFVAGTNRLQFVVANGTQGDPPGSDPSGLRVEIWGSASLDCAASRTPAQLSIARQAAKVVVRWSQAGFILQSATDVRGPWLDTTRGISVNGTDFSATLSASGPARFFRLRLDCP